MSIDFSFCFIWFTLFCILMNELLFWLSAPYLWKVGPNAQLFRGAAVSVETHFLFSHNFFEWTQSAPSEWGNYSTPIKCPSVFVSASRPPSQLRRTRHYRVKLINESFIVFCVLDCVEFNWQPTFKSWDWN